MATRKSVDRRGQIAGQILRISPATGENKSSLKDGPSRYVPADDYNELLQNAKKLAGSILSSKEPRRGLGGLLFGR